MLATSLLERVTTLVDAEDALAGHPQANIHIHNPELRQIQTDLKVLQGTYTPEQSVATQQNILLMQEVHHRVKNSLQLVYSLLSAQARRTVNEVAARQLGDSAARIRAIGEMHNRLYQTQDMQELDVKLYLEGLLIDLRKAMLSTTPGRLIRLNAEPVSWPAEDILTIGLILTELVTNAVKYGAGTVSIYFQREAGGGAFLAVQDEGNVIAGFDTANNPGFGTKLIQTLLSQRGGSLKIDPAAKSTRFIASFPPVEKQMVQTENPELENVKQNL
jgi:two-component sensor histidine kinase